MQSDGAIRRSRWFPASQLSRTRLTHLGILALFPLILALLNDYWAFTTSQSPMIDPWLYTSYFLHLKAQLLAFPGAYYGDRLSFTVPGWALYHLFGPWIGNYVLKLSTIYTAIFALYYAVLTLFDEQTALICGALISVQPYFLMAFGWDYVDGIGIAYYSLSLLFVLRASTSHRWRMSLFIAGIFTTCLVATQLLWLNIAWTVPLLYFVANRLYSKHPLGKSLGLFLAGAGVAFAACCGIYYILTGHWFFIENSVRHTLHGFDAAQKMATSPLAWIGYAHWLVPYNALMPVALWCLFRRRETSRQRICLALFAVSYVTIWVWEFAGFPFTKLLYYSDYIFPVYVLALAALLNDWAGKLRHWSAVITAAIVLAVGGGLVFSIPALDKLTQMLPGFLQTRQALWPMWHYQALYAAAIGATAGVCLCLPRFQRTLTGVFIGASLLMFGIQLTFHGRQGWFSASVGSDYTNKEGFRLIVQADAWADEIRRDRRVLVWYNQTEPRLGVFAGLSSLYLWGWSLLNVNLPDVDKKENERIQAYGDALLMTWDPDAIAKARQSLETVGWEVAREQETTITRGKLALHLGFFDLSSTTDATRGLIDREGLREISGVLNLSEVLPTTPESFFDRREGVHITTPPGQWTYAAYELLPFSSQDRDKVWIRVSAKILSGQAGFGILNRSENAFLTRTTVGPSAGYSTAMLEVEHPEDAGKLIIENDTPGGSKADLVVSDIKMLARPGSKIWERLTKERSIKEGPRGTAK